MGMKLSGYIRYSLRMIYRHRDYYERNPAEREHRWFLLRALLALPPDGVEAIERRELPPAEVIQQAANATGVSIALVEETCANFVFFFRPGLSLRTGKSSERKGD